MKKSKLFVFGGLAFGLVFSMLGFSKMESNVQAVKAEGASGTVKIYLGPNWAEANCNVSVYFFDDANHLNGWGSYVAVTAGQTEVDVSYNLEWTPVNMIAVRYNSSFNQTSWESNRWGDGDNLKWGQAPASGGYVFSDHFILKGWDTADTVYPYIKSSADNFANEKVVLDNFKFNGSNHLEYYNDAIDFAENEEFKVIYNNVWYNGYSTADVVNNHFGYANGENANIKCLVNGTYSLYFDSESKSAHITDPALAAADKFAQDFLGANCDASRSNWSDLADEFAALSPEAKALLVDEEHVAHDANIEGYIKRAVQRYDYVLERYHINAANTDELGYEDFMGRATKINLSPRMNSISIFAEGENSNAIVVTLIIVSLLATGGALLFLRKRKLNRLGR